MGQFGTAFALQSHCVELPSALAPERSAPQTKEPSMSIAEARTARTSSTTDLSFSSVVCFRCSYQATDGQGSCPDCGFPLIHQEESTPTRGARLDTMLTRESIRTGAPLLPGVDPEKRQGQLLREARQRRRRASSTITEERIQQRDAQRAEMRPLRPATQEPTVVVEDARTSRLWHMPLLCLSAITVGVLAAVAQGAL